MIETRNGSDEVLRRQVYGRGYVNELVQIGINHDPSNANSQSNAENDCERFVYVPGRQLQRSGRGDEHQDCRLRGHGSAS